ncbi:MAG: penicillin-binding protein [Candidatus Gracilibacteria bacterium]|nr:penicillin-binding protein [Candidatus Gracilibacteria bacterium]
MPAFEPKKIKKDLSQGKSRTLYTASGRECAEGTARPAFGSEAQARREQAKRTEGLRKRASEFAEKTFQTRKIGTKLREKYTSLKEHHQSLSPRKRFLRWFYYLAWLILLGIAVGVVSSLILLFVAVVGLPSAEELVAKTVAAESTKIFDRNGELLYEVHGDERRTVVTLDEVSPYLVKATLAAEDDEFYLHPGYDWKGIARSVYIIVINKLTGQGTTLVGGSTITQQFVKNAYLSQEKRIVRKLKELILSLKLEANLKDKEKKYIKEGKTQAHWIDFEICDEEQVGIETCRSKNKILELYLNRIPFGGTAYGAETASQNFFAKPAQELTLAESATLAAIPQRPTYFSPYGSHIDDLMARKEWILGRMLSLGYISQTEYDKAMSEELHFERSREDIMAAHFVFYVKELLEEKYDETLLQAGGLSVTTTLDYELQKIAEEKVAAGAEKNTELIGASNAALISLDPQTGQILAMVGSRDFFNEEVDGQVNVTTSYRQPGSSFKPITYAEAFLKGFYPANVVFDVVTNFGMGYEPENYDGLEHGAVSLRTALAHSLNIPAVKVQHLAGVEDTLELANKMGLKNLERYQSENYGLSLALGTATVRLMDLASAYGVFATGGYYHEPVAILEVRDSRGEVIEKYEEKDPLATVVEEPVLDPEVAYLITDILSDVAARPEGWGYLSVGGYKVATKTGTSTKPKPGTDKLYPSDILTIGYTPDLVTAVWAGNTNGEPLYMNATGVGAAAPIWNGFMKEALPKTAGTVFQRPAGIQEIAVSKRTGFLPGKNTSPADIKTEVFTSFSKPERSDQGFQSAVVDAVTGKLATEYTPPASRVTYICEDYHSILFYINQEDPQYQRWETRVREWARKQQLTAGEENINPLAPVRYVDCSDIPTEYDDLHTAQSSEDMPEVTFQKPFPGGKIQQGDNLIKLGIDAPEGVRNVELYLDSELQNTRAAGGEGEYWLSIPDSFALDSWHQLMVRVYDRVGNLGIAMAEVSVVADAEPPTINILSPQEGESFFPGDQLEIKVQSMDTGSGLTELEFTMDGAYLGTLDQPPFNLELTVPEKTKTGEHTITVRAFDAESNVSRQDLKIEVKKAVTEED